MLLAAAAPVFAGGSGENVLLVVNERSWGSLSAANHYIRLRRIPPINVVYLDWAGDVERIDGDTFRTKILGPVLGEIDRRRISDHIDAIVYSTDFPWSIDFSADAQGKELPNTLNPTASITGATYLYPYVQTKRIEFVHPEVNRYFRGGTAREVPASHGFRAWYGWGIDGKLLEAGGERYAPSAMLGVTSGRGNSVREVIDYLTTAAGADFTRPAGTIYYLSNADVRSTTRAPLFDAAVEAIGKEGVRAERIDGVLPVGKPDVAGAMLGTEQFDWKTCRSKIVPGAICEHLTSSGGVLSENAGQTPISELLRAGAALSSGAVAEPYAIPNKFPSAYMHLHYVRGCSAGEAFYQSTNSPYQMLLLGDALCRPWARAIEVSIGGIADDGRVAGALRLKPTAKFAAAKFGAAKFGADNSGGADNAATDDGAMGKPAAIARYELLVDGLLVAACGPDDAFDFDTRVLPDGVHELRIAAVAAGPIETRVAAIRPVRVSNTARTATLTRIETGPVRWGEPLKLRAEAPDAIGIALTQGTRRLATIQGNAGTFEIDPRVLGRGPVTLQAVAIGRTGPTSNLLSELLEIDVEPNEPAATYGVPAGAVFRPNMQLVTGGGQTRLVAAMAEPDWLEGLGIGADETFTQTGFLTVDEDGVYQFRLEHNLEVTLAVDDRVIGRFNRTAREADYAAAALRHGLHKIELRVKTRAEPRLDVRFGLRGTRRLQPVSMTHISAAAPKP